MRGAVSAIMLSSALTQLLSSDEYVLVNPGQDYASGKRRLEDAGAGPASFATPDPQLIYSEVIPLKINDPQSRWLIWAGFPN